MALSLIERQVENAIREMFSDKAARIMRSVSKIAAKQGGDSTIENYQLLGKRALVGLGAVFVVVQVAASAVSFVVSRKSEEQRIERVVRRVLEEEQQKTEKTEAEA